MFEISSLRNRFHKNNYGKMCTLCALMRTFPPGEPREHFLGELRVIQNFIKDNMTESVDMLECIFEIIAKKLKMK